MYPRKSFIMNLEKIITDTIKLVSEVILCADANEHVSKGNLAIQLRKLGLVEAYNKSSNLQVPLNTLEVANI